VNDEVRGDDIREALRQLRTKLLDLSGRNRLLNFKHTPGRSLQSVEGDLQAIYDRLIETTGRTSILIRGVPEPPRSDWVLRDGRRVPPEIGEWAAAQNIATGYELPGGGGGEATFRALLYPDILAKHCRKLEREANLAIEETGANMLFLVLGFLEYPGDTQGDRQFLAPLISIPVALSSTARDGERTFEIEGTGDDLAANLSLHEKLRADHELELPHFDEDEGNVEHYLAEVKRVVRAKQGFIIRRRVSLCLLSFTNMLLLRDLDPQNWPSAAGQNELLDHEVVRQLFAGRADDGSDGFAEPTSHPVDDAPGVNIPLVFDADSSQHSALIDALQAKRNLVIEGPPGTGKSQTITNLIAACIAEGRTVLFVSEKLAALEVVKSRLATAGLDPFVLELHSSKTSKKRVLEEINARLQRRPRGTPDLDRKLAKLDQHRQQLRAYVDLLKSVTGNAMGLTVHALIWRAERHRGQLSSDDFIRAPPAVDEASALSVPEFDSRADALRYLAEQFAVIGRFDAHSPFWGFYPERLLPGDEHRLEQLFTSAIPWAAEFISDAEAVTTLAGARVGFSVESARAQLRSLEDLAAAVPAGAPMHLFSRMFTADSTGAQVKQLIARIGARLERYRVLAPTVEAGLRTESAATDESLHALKDMVRLVSGWGGAVASVREMTDTATQLSQRSEALSRALAELQAFCDARRVPFGDSRGVLQRLHEFFVTCSSIPEGHWRLYHDGLADEGATGALEELEQRQQKWQQAHRTIERHLYLDPLPESEPLREAILTLREGDRWYRIFQRKWRQASSLHRRLRKGAKKISAEDRLTDLEDIERYIRLRDQWRKAPAWSTVCRCTPEAEPLALDGFLAISRWHDAIRAGLSGLGAAHPAVPALSREEARRYRQDYIDASSRLETLLEHLKAIDTTLPALVAMPDGQSVPWVIQRAHEMRVAIEASSSALAAACSAETQISACTAAFEAAIERRKIAEELEHGTSVRKLLADQYRGMATDVSGLLKVIEWGQTVQAAPLPASLRRRLLGTDALLLLSQAPQLLKRVIESLLRATEFEQSLQEFDACDVTQWAGCVSSEDIVRFARGLHDRLVIAVQRTDELVEWSRYIARRREALSLGNTKVFVESLEASRVRSEELAAAFGFATFTSILHSIFRDDPVLRRFSGRLQDQVRRDFQQLDKEVIEIRGSAIGNECLRRRAPAGHNGTRVGDKTEMALLSYLMPQQRPRVPVRQMLARAPVSVQTLKPCLMMGPHAVAQFLKPGRMRFDVVIMDEASQLSPAEAIGAVARGRQLIVVGDPKQLPPTNFFRRQGQVDEDDEEYATTDTESILDQCVTSFRPPRRLLWHYRSRHHSLIAFSNRQFYDSSLIICPSPYGKGRRLGIQATYLAEAVYENQTNLVEARRVVDAIAEHIATRPDESLGVVTLNIKQRDLIDELLAARLAPLPAAEEFRKRWHGKQQGLFVKNLETVQGDERDCIIISTTFGRPPGVSKPRQNFGPISRQGGWRRLNVLFTRARNSIGLFTSLKPEDIVIDGTTPDGTKALRAYLEYARSGVLEVPAETGEEPESDFELAVIDVLRTMGYEVTPQLGVSGFRIDIAVHHPDFPGAYLAAIECDGAQYHSARSARDRDRIRQEILESQGWEARIWRIWSTDWFQSPHQEIAKLKAFLDRLRATWKPEHVAGESWVEEGTPRDVQDVETSDEETQTQRQIVDEHLLDDEAEKDVRIGDLVDYVDPLHGQEPKHVRITKRMTDPQQGLIAEATPLAQVLLGAVVGDEVVLSVPGMPERLLRIVGIKRDEQP
jgi:transcription elongation GreA/GreB family factor